MRIAGYTYDAAQNLLARAEATAWGSDLTALPLDGSGRNRPASVDGVALEYDAAGNLTRKGDRTLHYDAFNRLVRVADGSGPVATYRYDALNRRIEATAGGTTRTTTWAGWQALEERTDGTLAERRTFGLGLDEVVLTERDTDGDGAPDQRDRPLFDSIGNVALLLDESGTVIERYDYSPFGDRWVEVNDLTAPQVEQVRVENGALVLELSEEVSEAALAAGETAGLLVLEETATSAAVPFAWSLPVTEGRVARRRLVLTPDTVPAGGTELRVVLGAGALADLFGNANAAPHEQVFGWNDGVITDTAAPELLVVALAEGRLRVTFSEPVDPATVAAALLLDGAPSAWTATADGYTLETDSALPSGSHTLRLETTLTDLASQPLAVAFETTFEAASDHRDRLIHLAADPHLLTTSTVGNRYGFHGRPVDPETGLMYFRSRYYDPEMGRFVTTDPLGYVDGPNLYQYAMNSPVNFSDPLGLRTATQEDTLEIEALQDRLSSFDQSWEETGSAEVEILDTRYEPVAWYLPAKKEKVYRWNLVQVSDQQGYRRVRKQLERDLNSFVAAVERADDDGHIDYFRGTYYTITHEDRVQISKDAALYLAPIAIGDLLAMKGGRGGSSRPSAAARPGRSARAPRSMQSVPSSRIWTPTQSKSAAQNAFRHFKDHGADFGARNAVEYVRQAQQFLRSPPPGTLTRLRSNGDVIRYNPSTNTFGVMDASGAPRTLFKPNPAIHGYRTNLEYFNAQ